MKTNVNKSNPASAFTLIEVMVSVAILATGLVMILRAYTTALVAMDTSDEVIRVSLLMDEKMGQVEAGLRQDGSSMSVLDGPFTSGDLAGEIALKQVARLSSVSTTVVRADMVIRRSVSGHSYQASSCFSVMDR